MYSKFETMKMVGSLLLGMMVVGCGPQSGSVGVGAVAADDDIAKLSDEFSDANGLSAWSHIDKTEGWGADQLSQFGVQDGQLMMVPFASTWYMDYRGVLVYKDIPGDFVVTTKVRATGSDGRSAPRSSYSLGGIMVRNPRSDNAQSWRSGGENYVFLSLGSADKSGQYQFEVKTTQNSQSNLEKVDAANGEALLQVAKIGSQMILLRKQGGSWMVHKRYNRPDFGKSLQVGLTVYSDYNTASQLPAKQHNGTAIRQGNPDLIARFDFVRFRRPSVPAGLDAGRASDGELLKFLGDSAM
jgi:hypothetical protein